MANYVQGFVTPVPRKNIKAYMKMAKKMADFCKRNGALDYVECQGDNVPPGKTTSFPQSVKLKTGEVVFFSWITFKSRAQCDKAMKKMMTDPEWQDMEMPFDGKRMIYGGFKTAFTM